MDYKLDRIDLDILSLLLNDSRISLTEMANRLGLSRPTVRERLRKLIKNGVIKGFTIKLDESIFKGITVLYQFKPKDLNSLIELLKEKHEVTQIFLTSGGESIFAIASYENFDRMNDDVNEFIDRGENFNFYIVIRKIKDEPFIPILAFELNCDYCGKKITENPIKYTLYNRDFYFCCKTCLNNFRKSRE